MKVILHPGGGLANRILAINSTMQLCRDLDIERNKLEIIWRNNAECACDWEDVFSENGAHIININLPKNRTIENIRKYRFYEAIMDINRNISYRLLIRRFRNYMFSPYCKEYSDEVLLGDVKHFLCNNNEIFIDAYSSYYGRTDIHADFFSKDVLDRVSVAKSEIGNYVALHIRRTDNHRCIELNPIKDYEDIIKKELSIDKLRKIYVSTDDDELFRKLKGQYDRNIIEINGIERTRLTKQGMKDAAFELLMLAEADRIYGSVGSTFTDVAKEINANRKK